MISFIHGLKEVSLRTVKVYAMSNISKEDYAVLSTKIVNWSVLDRVFTSGHASMRKQDLDFYNHVLEENKLAPEGAVVIDDKIENAFAAKFLGIESIVFDGNSTISRALRNMFDDPVPRGMNIFRGM